MSGWSTEGLLKTALRTPIYSSHQEKKEVLSNIHALQELLLTTLKLCFWCLITCASWWNNVKFFWVAPTYTLVPHMIWKYSNATRAAGFLLRGWHLNGFRCRRYFFIFIFIVAADGKTLLSPMVRGKRSRMFPSPAPREEGRDEGPFLLRQRQRSVFPRRLRTGTSKQVVLNITRAIRNLTLAWSVA